MEPTPQPEPEEQTETPPISPDRAIVAAQELWRVKQKLGRKASERDKKKMLVDFSTAPLGSPERDEQLRDLDRRSS